MIKVASFKQESGRVSVNVHEDGQKLISEYRAEGWMLSTKISQKAVYLEKGTDQLWIFSSKGVLQYD